MDETSSAGSDPTDVPATAPLDLMPGASEAPVSRLLHLFREPTPLLDMLSALLDLRSSFGDDLVVVPALRGIEIRTSGARCDCLTCVSEEQSLVASLGASPFFGAGGGMSVCPVCGNKRCPKATHHLNRCTGSNEPGQPGSAHAR